MALSSRWWRRSPVGSERTAADRRHMYGLLPRGPVPRVVDATTTRGRAARAESYGNVGFRQDAPTNPGSGLGGFETVRFGDANRPKRTR